MAKEQTSWFSEETKICQGKKNKVTKILFYDLETTGFAANADICKCQSLKPILTGPPCINYMQYPWGYAVPVRICITRESYHQYLWVISSVPVRVCITRESYHQYLWVISSVPVRIRSTRESYPQYPWVISSVPVRICSTRESYPQYPWVISSVPVRICSTRESYHQYPWVISSVPVRLIKME